MQNRQASWRSKLPLAAVALCCAAAWLPAQDPEDVAPSAKLEQVKQTVQQKQSELNQKYREAKDDAERGKLYEQYRADLKHAVEDARAVADLAVGTETAAEAWAFVLQNAQQAGAKELGTTAFGTLVDKHLSSSVWEELAPMLANAGDLGIEAAALERSLRTLAAKSPYKGVRAGAMFGLGVFLGEQKEAAKRAEGIALIRKLQQDFADVQEAQEFVAQAEGTLFQLEHLQPGMPCPDFEASDEAGTKFKLSDYKGKVVLIDFWGYW